MYVRNNIFSISFMKYYILSLHGTKEGPTAMFLKKKENRICVDYVRCAPNNVVRFRSSLMAAAGALITTKYGPISPPVLDRFAISSQPAYCRRRTVTSPFACGSSTNRRIRSVVYRRRHGRRHGGGPWISNEKFDFRARQSSTARRSLINSLLQDTCDGKNIYFLFYF